MVKNQLYTFQIKVNCDSPDEAEFIDKQILLLQDTDCIRTGAGISLNNDSYQVGFTNLTNEAAVRLLTKLSSIGQFTVVDFRETY